MLTGLQHDTCIPREEVLRNRTLFTLKICFFSL